MQAGAWKNGGNTYGISVGVSNRNDFFDPNWTAIEVEMDGRFYRFALTPGFWHKCPEFRDRDTPIIKGWLHRHHTLDWADGKPPKFELIPLGDGRFRLVP